MPHCIKLKSHAIRGTQEGKSSFVISKISRAHRMSGVDQLRAFIEHSK